MASNSATLILVYPKQLFYMAIDGGISLAPIWVIASKSSATVTKFGENCDRGLSNLEAAYHRKKVIKVRWLDRKKTQFALFGVIQVHPSRTKLLYKADYFILRYMLYYLLYVIEIKRI